MELSDYHNHMQALNRGSALPRILGSLKISMRQTVWTVALGLYVTRVIGLQELASTGLPAPADFAGILFHFLGGPMGVFYSVPPHANLNAMIRREFRGRLILWDGG